MLPICDSRSRSASSPGSIHWVRRSGGFIPERSSRPEAVAISLPRLGLELSSRCVALGTGELAAGYGAISPGLFNAWSRGVRTALVADGGLIAHTGLPAFRRAGAAEG